MTCTSADGPTVRVSRRRFLAASTVAGVGALWWPVARASAGASPVSCPVPPGFPADIPIFRQAFENWAGTTVVEDAWTCAPRSANQVVELANWAYASGYRLRARGKMHNWSPLTVPDGADCDSRIVLVGTEHLAEMQVLPGQGAAVRVGTGATMEALLGYLESHGLGLASTPAPGDLTVGGVLAIDGHGTGVRTAAEPETQGLGYGSLSNLVLSLTAVIWDDEAARFVLRSFDRRHPDAKALLTHLGRAFVTEAVLQVGANHPLRCVSRVDIPASELFADPDEAGDRSLAAFVERTGRVEAIWFPFTQKPWLKVWSVSPSKPLPSRAVGRPYNYAFSDNVPKQIAELAGQVISGNGALTPAFGNAMYSVTATGLAATLSADIWGPSKNLLLYVQPTTLRVQANGYAVLCSRAHIQRAVADFAVEYRTLVDAYRSRGLYPMNMPVEIRVTGLDVADDVSTPEAEPPALSAITPRRDHPEWEVAVWFDVLSFPGTPAAEAWYRELEAWFVRHFDGSWATVRPEWSKGWAYSDRAAWDDETAVTQTIPGLYRAGRAEHENWDWARDTLDAYDPGRVWSNAFLDRLLP